MAKREKFLWEKIDSVVPYLLGPSDATFRSRIPGGWLMKYVYRGDPARSAHAIAYVPDAEGNWAVSEKSLKWEKVNFKRTPNEDSKTLRLRVPGGWLIRDGCYVKGHLSISMEFVPDPSHSWET